MIHFLTTETSCCCFNQLLFQGALKRPTSSYTRNMQAAFLFGACQQVLLELSY